MRTYIIPEAGGDAGVGALRMLADCEPDAHVVLVDARFPNPSNGLWPEDRTTHIQVPIVEGNPTGAKAAFFEQFDPLGIDDFELLPTGEFFPEVVFMIDDERYCHFMPSEDGWKLSRDKKSLSREISCFANAKDAWTNRTPLIKPRYGCGSRGVFIIHTEEEAMAIRMSPLESIFTEYILGDDYLVDVVNGNAWTRRITRQRGGGEDRKSVV